MYEDFMRGMSVLHLRFTVYAKDRITFGPQPGTALRGALYQALSEHFCSERDGQQTPGHSDRCPVCGLMAAERDAENAVRGVNPPRAITVQPPERTEYAPRETFSFGVGLIGASQSVLPYLLLAIPTMAQTGVAKGRGRFELLNVEEYSPLWDTARIIMNGNRVSSPTLQVTPARVLEWAEKYPPDRITLRLETPLRLISGGALCQKPYPDIFVQRLLERCQNLAERFSEDPTPPTREQWRMMWQDLSAHAADWKITFNETEWLDVWSGSQRTRTVTPVGGLRGVVRWEGDIAPLRTWLLWGQSLHVGKDTVKGNGWYKVMQ